MNTLKKFFNILLIIIGVVFIGLCAELLTNRTLNTAYDNLDDLDKSALGEVCDIISLFDEEKGNDDIWDIKFNPRNVGCVITSKEGFFNRSYAVNVYLSGNVFAQKIDMPDDYSDISVYRLSFFCPQTFLIEDDSYVELDNQNVYSLKYTGSSVKLNGAGSFQESYIKNTFSHAVETPDSPSAAVQVSFGLDEENIALMGLQYRIIDDMMNAKSKAELNELIAEYVTVREYQAKMYPDFASQQQRIELVDGRAQYVFYKISAMTGHNMTYFNKEKSSAINFYSAYHYLCTGRYNDEVSEFVDYKGNVYTGAALCEILDNNNISKNWERKLDNSTNSSFVSQYSLIKSYCSKECSEYAGKTIDDIKREYSYEQIIKMARALVEGNAE